MFLSPKSLQVLGLRSTYEQLLRMLSAEDRDQVCLKENMGEFLQQGQVSLNLNGVPNMLAQLICSPLTYNPYNADQWYMAVKCIDDRLQMAEEAAIPHLRKCLSTTTFKCV